MWKVMFWWSFIEETNVLVVSFFGLFYLLNFPLTLFPLNLFIVAFSFKTLLIRKYLYLLFHFSDQSQEIGIEVISHAKEMNRFLRFSTVPLLKKKQVFIAVRVVNFRTSEIDMSCMTRWKLVPNVCQKDQFLRF